MDINSTLKDLNSAFMDLNSAFMELLVRNLKEKLSTRIKKEYERMEQYNKNNSNDLMLISSGRIIEIDFLINSMNEMITYYEHSKIIEQ
jgi:nicotinamide riboside kinase